MQRKLFWLIQSLKELRIYLYMIKYKIFISREKVRQEWQKWSWWSSFEGLSTFTMCLCAVGKRCSWRHEIWEHVLSYCQKGFGHTDYKRTNTMMDILGFKLNSLGGCRHGWVTFRFVFTLPPSTHFYWGIKTTKLHKTTKWIDLNCYYIYSMRGAIFKQINQHLHHSSIVWPNTPGSTW